MKVMGNAQVRVPGLQNLGCGLSGLPERLDKIRERVL